MKKRNWLPLLIHLASPVAVILLGLILLFNPDSASALISRLLGWGICLAGLGFGIAALFDRDDLVKKLIPAALCFLIGNWLLGHPLALASGIGRLLGALLLLRGLRDVAQARKWGHGKILAYITTALGVILILAPLTTSRLVFSLCGLVVLVVGIAMLLDRLKDRRQLEQGDPNIIDAL